jgi:predicted ATPase with chaperone activity
VKLKWRPVFWAEYALLGPPGAGKSMLARRLTTILPVMTLAEALETTRLHRVADLTGRAHGGGHVPPVSCPAPHHLGCRADRRRASPQARRGVEAFFF